MYLLKVFGHWYKIEGAREYSNIQRIYSNQLFMLAILFHVLMFGVVWHKNHQADLSCVFIIW